MKYIIVMENKQFKENSKYRKTYRKYKCSDGWDFSPVGCWEFTKQGAEKKIEALKREYKVNYDKGIIEFSLIEAKEEA